jgi:hypothetical protein
MSSQDLAINFEKLFRRSLAHEPLGPFEQELSNLFEFVAATLLGAFPSRKGQYFDGVVNLSTMVRKPRQVVYRGDMWIGSDSKQWTEVFEATVTDRRITKQGLRIAVSIGADEAEGEIWTIFGRPGNAEPAGPDQPATRFKVTAP